MSKLDTSLTSVVYTIKSSYTINFTESIAIK